MTAKDKIVSIEQFRPPLGKRAIESPPGLAGDVPGQAAESLADAARRELLEESGYEDRALIFLASGPPSPGFTSEVVSFFRATDLRKVYTGGGEGAEDIHVREVPLRLPDSWLAQKIEQGLLVDLKVYASFTTGSIARSHPLPTVCQHWPAHSRSGCEMLKG